MADTLSRLAQIALERKKAREQAAQKAPSPITTFNKPDIDSLFTFSYGGGPFVKLSRNTYR